MKPTQRRDHESRIRRAERAAREQARILRGF
jgi:hypothetical protein